MKSGTKVRVIFPEKAAGENYVGVVVGKTQLARRRVITVRLASDVEVDFDPSQLEVISDGI